MDQRARHRRRRPSGSTRRALTKDENDNRLDVFPDAGTDAQTVVQTPGVAVSTSRYGDPGSYQPEYRAGARVRRRPAHAVGGRRAHQGHRPAAAPRPRPADHHRPDQPRAAARRAHAPLPHAGRPQLRRGRADHRRPRPTRRAPPTGQTVTFPTRTFRRLDVTIADTNVGDESAQPASQQRRLRRDPPAGRRARRGVRARRRDRAHAHRSGRCRGRGRGRPPARVPDDPARTVVVPPHFSAGRGRAGAALPRARRPHVRDSRRPRGSRPTRPTT